MSNKSGFSIETLHAIIDKPKDANFIGTEFVIYGIDKEILNQAKKMFVKFSGLYILEQTSNGQVLSNLKKAAIFINGVLVAEEDNFMFSYNITNISSKIKKALNRERSNVGRSAYTDSVKKYCYL